MNFSKKTDTFPEDYFKTSSSQLKCDSNIIVVNCVHAHCKLNGSIIRLNIKLKLNNVKTKCYYHKFKVEKTEFLLCIYPNGINAKNTSYLSIFLFNKSVINYKDELDTLIAFDYDSNDLFHHKFTSDNYFFGFIKWKNKYKFEILNTDVVIMCIHDVCLHEVYKITEMCNNSDLYDNILLKPQDVVLKGDNWLYKTYGEILKQKSRVFAKVISFKNDTNFCINIPFVEESIIRDILSYFNANRILMDTECALKLIPLCCAYEIDGLKLACEFILYLHLFYKTNEGGLVKLDYSFLNWNLNILKNVYVDKVLKEFKSIVVAKKWMELLKKQKNVALEITRNLSKSIRLDKKCIAFLMHPQRFSTAMDSFLTCIKTSINLYKDIDDDCLGSITYITLKCNLKNGNFLWCGHSFQTEGAQWKLVLYKNSDMEYPIVYITNPCINGTVINAEISFNENKVYHYKFFDSSNYFCIELKKQIASNEFCFNILFRCILHDEQCSDKTNYLSVYRQFNGIEIVRHQIMYYPDITLKGDSWSFRVHKKVLIENSDVFKAMFSHDTSESLTNTVNIHHVSSEAMTQIISFLYTGRMLVNNLLMDEICAFAHLYNIKELKLACEHQLCFSLSVELVSYLFTISSKYDMEILNINCVNFIGNKFNDVVRTEGWQHFMLESNEAEKLFCRLFQLYDIKKKELKT